MALQPYQLRVLGEKNALDEKIGKLGAFIVSDIFNGVEKSEQNRLLIQHYVMRQYVQVLNERISAFH